MIKPVDISKESLHPHPRLEENSSKSVHEGEPNLRPSSSRLICWRNRLRSASLSPGESCPAAHHAHKQIYSRSDSILSADMLAYFGSALPHGGVCCGLTKGVCQQIGGKLSKRNWGWHNAERFNPPRPVWLVRHKWREYRPHSSAGKANYAERFAPRKRIPGA